MRRGGREFRGWEKEVKQRSRGGNGKGKDGRQHNRWKIRLRVLYA